MTATRLAASLWASVFLSGLGGCSAPATSTDIAPGAVAQALSLAAEESGVPRDLLVAIAAEERGLRLAPHRMVSTDDHVPVAGYLELRHGKRDTLALGAALAGVAQSELIEDTTLGTRAAAKVLAQLGRETGATSELSTWTSALEELSGLNGAARTQYAKSVLTQLHDGGRFAAWGGEVVRLDAHSDAVPSANTAPTPENTTPQFPGAIWFETSCDNKCDTTRTTPIDMIVIHDTEGAWDASVATLQNDPEKSVHYIVDADGSRVGQFVDESVNAWHAGNSAYNNRAIGIEHVGYAADPDGYSDGLYVTSAKLVENIVARNHIAVDRTHIVGHYQVPNGSLVPESNAPCSDPLLSCEANDDFGGASNHRDPGPNWQWCQYMQRLGGSCTCDDAYAHLNCTTDRTQAVRCVNGQVEIVTCASACVTKSTGQDDDCVPATSNGGTPVGTAPVATSPADSGSANPIVTTAAPSTSSVGAAASSLKGVHPGCNVVGTSAVGDLSLVALMVIGLAMRRRRLA